MLARYVQKNLTWIDLVSPTPAEVKAVMHEFSIDPLLAAELTSPSPKSKAERHHDMLYLVLHFPALRGTHARPMQEIDFIMGREFLITARYENIDPLHLFAKSFEVNTVLGREHSEHGGHLFVAMVQSLYRSLMAECDALRARLDTVEDGIFAGRERKMVAQISEVGRMIHDFRRTISPHMEMLQSLEPAGERLFGAAFSYHVRTLLNEEGRVRRTLEHLREWLNELRDTNDSLLEVKQNEIMKNLTVLTFTFLPLTFISSLFAMDFDLNPITGHENDFFFALGGMAVVGIACLLYFKRKKWI